MKVVYTIPVRPGVEVPVPAATAALTLPGATLSWERTAAGHLAALVVTFTGAEVRYGDTGAILPTYPELEESAYRMVSYVANRLFVQTSFDPLDADHVLAAAPAIAPETEAEEVLFKAKHTLLWKNMAFGWAVRGAFDPAAYAAGFGHSAAYGYFADANRAGNEFQGFEILYKVVEYFFPENGAALDAAVSAHVTPHDAAFTPVAVEQLRLLRNRAVHPRARKGHVSPENIANVREVHANMPAMRRLATLLLAHPTF